MKKAFHVFDKKWSGKLSEEHFKRMMPMLGEDLSPTQVDDMFDAVDSDGSGWIELEEVHVH